METCFYPGECEEGSVGSSSSETGEADDTDDSQSDAGPAHGIPPDPSMEASSLNVEMPFLDPSTPSAPSDIKKDVANLGTGAGASCSRRWPASRLQQQESEHMKATYMANLSVWTCCSVAK